MEFLCAVQTSEDIAIRLTNYQATANLLSRILIFVLDCDEIKMTNPSIQNDFSYYRRTLSRMKLSPEFKEKLDSAPVKDELANRMSLFYAYPTPMMKCFAASLLAVTSKSADTIAVEKVAACLRTLIVACHGAVAERRYVNSTSFLISMHFRCVVTESLHSLDLIKKSNSFACA